MQTSPSLLVTENPLDQKPLFWRIFLPLAALVAVVAAQAIYQSSVEQYVFENSLKVRAAILAGAGMSVAIALLALLSFTPWFRPVDSALRRGFAFLKTYRLFSLFLFGLCLAVYPWLVFDRYGALLNRFWIHVSLFLLVGAAAGVFLRAAFPRLRWGGALLLALITLMAVTYTISFAPEVSDNPLTQEWSEGSRYYYASLFFAKPLYGEALPLPFLHPSRYLMQAVPFLIPNLPIEAHRAWQVFLWLGMTALTAFLLVRRLEIRSRSLGWAVGAWAFLFLFQGPVYYHLLVPVCLVLWGFSPREFPRSLAVIVAASAWAGISRINWLPVPAMIAISIFLLEMPQCGARGLVDYLRRPFWWGIAGGLSAFASNWLYKRFSGNDPSIFNTSFTSDLLWYRLLPNATFPPGILLSSLIVLLPLALVLAGVLWGRRLSLLRKAGIAAMLLVLLGGGIVVSTKIGGGSNLHNIDAFLVLLLVCASWAAFNRAVPEVSAAPLRVHWVVVLLAVMVPIFTLFQNIYPFPVKSPTARLDAQSDTAEIAARVKAATDGGGRVLFIWQRQLMTFGQVSGVPMEPRYETVDLMEMAMSDNEAYLNQFYEDLREHRFALIIADNQRIVFKSLDESFSEENNVWVERVLLPLLDSYRAEKTLPYSGTRFMVPK